MHFLKYCFVYDLINTCPIMVIFNDIRFVKFLKRLV
jgi:hypothetical protein